MSAQKYIEQQNGNMAISVDDIPVLPYKEFYELVIQLTENECCHCVNYFVVPNSTFFRFYCCLADDSNAKIYIFSHLIARDHSEPLEAITAKRFSFHVFEREIHENFGINFVNHPWLKPLRYPKNRADHSQTMDNYPFYSISGGQLHEVGVGPVHAGVIEPGHFRFLCNGEKVFHLEIQLGYQHRGIEQLIVSRKSILQKSILAENIAGDSAVAHSIAFSSIIESISEIQVPENIRIERCIALELERIAIHIGDTAALCGDIAYQLGQVSCEALRTIVINSTQKWCGNRFGKGLIRPGGTNYPLPGKLLPELIKTVEGAVNNYLDFTERMFQMPSILLRFDGIGELTSKQASLIGAVGMVARSSGLPRDIRHSHPFLVYSDKSLKTDPVVLSTGDVLARATLRRQEVENSMNLLRRFSAMYSEKQESSNKPVYSNKLIPNSFAIALTEGWRGEICHVAITNDNGDIYFYKIKDPSLHNWTGLALAVRNQQISDFPICNKSFNLSYCGHDL
jgi:Ni,Fe-hydrogenase III large subunit